MEQHVYLPMTREAVRFLGQLIRLNRMQQRMTMTDLAERAGIARSTLTRIEKGDLRCEIGLVFEVAYLAGVNLFEEGDRPFEERFESVKDKLALLPQSIRKPKGKEFDDF